MRGAQGTLGLVVPRGSPYWNTRQRAERLWPKVPGRSGSGPESQDGKLPPSGRSPADSGLAGGPCATLPAHCRPLSLHPRWPCAWSARRRVQAVRYLGPRRGSNPTGRPARCSRCSPGSWSRCGPSAACRGPPFGPTQWNGPQTSSPGRARARAGSTAAT